jgi:hypothetical protein
MKKILKNIRQTFALFFFMIANKLDTRDIHDLKAELDRLENN